MPGSTPTKLSFKTSERLSLLFLLICCLAGAAFFSYRINAIYSSIGSYDFPIFIHHARMYLASGQLYLTDLVQYYPVSPVYKFPPLFACILINLIQAGMPEPAIYKIFFSLQLFCYFSTALLSIYYFESLIPIKHKEKKIIYYSLSILFALTFQPFIETLMPLQLETYTLMLFLLAFYFLNKEKPMLAGITVALGCMLKIYPLIFLLFFLLRRTWRALGGFALGIIVINIYTIAVIGIDSHIFYFTKILPVMMDEYPSEALTNISLAANMRGFYEYYQPYFSAFDEMPIKLLFRVQFLIFLLPVCWLTYKYTKNKTSSCQLLLLEYALFMILILLGLIDSWDNYQLLLLIPVIAFLTLLFSENKLDWPTLILLITSCSAVFITAYPPTRDRIPASYLYQYVVFRGLTSYFIYYVGFRLLNRHLVIQSA